MAASSHAPFTGGEAALEVAVLFRGFIDERRCVAKRTKARRFAGSVLRGTKLFIGVPQNTNSFATEKTLTSAISMC